MGGDLNITNTEFKNIRTGVISASTTYLNLNPNNINISNCLIVGPSTTGSTTALISLPKAGFNSYKIDHCTFINSTGSEVSLGLTTSTSYIKNSIFSNNINFSKANTYSVSLGDDCGIYYTSGGAQSSIYPNSSAAKVTDPALDASGYATTTEYLTGSTDGNLIGYYKTYGLVLSTQPATSITKTSALLYGTILSFDNTSVTSFGFCWNTTGTPTTADTKTDNGTKTTAGNFSNEITNLNGVTTYYVRAYAIDGKRTVYGDIQIVTTLANSYDVTIQVGANGTVSESNASISNGTALTVNTGETKTFTITPDAGYQITSASYNGIDIYSQIVNNQYTTAAVNAYGTLVVSFGNNIKTINVTTAGTLSSLLSTIDKSIITKLTVTGNIDARDVKCMRDEMTLLADLNLKDANIKAYNGNGGTYEWTNSYPANEIPQYSFYNSNTWTAKTSLKSIHLPTSTASTGTAVFQNCYNLKRIIILNQTPPTMPEFQKGFDGIVLNALYVPIGSVQAYKASASWNILDNMKPSELLVVTNIVEYKLNPTTQTATNIKLNTAKVNGTLDVITDSPVTAHGFCWNTTGTPTIADNKVDNGATTTEGTYSNVIDNLSGATTYYVRAFATDGTSGTVYGDEISFTTAEIPATSSLSGNYYNSQYWPLSKSPYTITGNVNLAEEANLTIEPGVVINFAGNYEIMTMSSIYANGTASDSITLNAYSSGCTFFDFKNVKLSNSELSYLKLIGNSTTTIKTQGTCTDSLSIKNSRIDNITLNNSYDRYNYNSVYPSMNFENCKLVSIKTRNTKTGINNSNIENSTFGIDQYSYGNSKLKNSTAKNSTFYGGAYDGSKIVFENVRLYNSSTSMYNPDLIIKNSIIESCNFNWNSGGNSPYASINKSKIFKTNFKATSSSPIINIDSTYFNYSTISQTGSVIINNSIFKTDSTQTLNLNGTISNSQFIGNNNKIGGIGLDAVTGTITNSSIVNHRIGLQTSALTINNSNLINNSQYAIKNTGATAIDAKNNFWGVGNTTTTTVKAKIWDYYKDMNLGKVAYDNYLTTPNTVAPITPPQNFRKVTGTSGVTYSWNANPESDIKGYKLYYGAFDGFTFANSIDLGNVTNYNLPTASINDTVLVTAYDLLADGKEDMLEGHESWYSEDVIMPAKAGSISGLTTVCQGKKSVSYSVPAIANASSYRWTLPTGATGTSTTRSITVDYSLSAISGKITVRGVNEYGEGDSTFVNITVNSLPDKAGPISGASTVCQAEKSLVYRIAAIPGATSYNWTLPEGVTGTSNADTIKVDFSKTAQTGKIRVKGINDCGVGLDSALLITVNPLPKITSQIMGSTTVCLGEKSKVYKINAPLNAISYQWILPTGLEGTSSLDSIVVDFGITAKSGEIKVVALNDCGISDTVRIAVTVKPLIGAIGEITGTSTLCSGSAGISYSIPAVDNALTYEWTLPTGASGTSTTNSITVDYSNSAVSGDITVKAKNDCGESAISKLTVTINHPTASTTKAKVCSKELPYVWNTTNYTETGIYSKTFVNAVGCDSIATLDLTVLLESASTTKAKLCSKELPYVWNATNYTETGIYSKTFVNAVGCDSIATLDLTVLLESASTTKAKVCAKELPYVWNATNYTETGIYSKTFENAVGCDSIATLDLTVLLESASITKAKLCAKELPYVWNATNYTETGIYSKTFVNAVGCDSIATLDLTVLLESASTTKAKVCSKELPYVWNATNYTETGIYSKTFVNAVGCDSIATLDLTVLLESASTTKAKLCAKELPYVWNATNYTETGIYSKTFVNAVGCDSIATLDLTVLLESASTTKAKLCSKELPYVWNATNYTETGIYSKTFVNAVGCDSIATLDLTVLLESASTTKAKVCSKELPYVWNATNYTETGIYSKTFVNAVGCDSIATLDLTVLLESASTTKAKVCSKELPYVWNATNYTETGIYTKTFVNAVGCDSIATLDLTVLLESASTTKAKVCAKELPYVWNATNYTETGIYSKTFVNAVGCDSIATLDLTVIPTSETPIITRIDNILKSSSTEGNQWYNLNGSINGAINQEYIVTENNEYYVIVTINGCSSEKSNIIQVSNTAVNNLQFNNSISIYPNPVKNELRIEFDGETKFEIINLFGQVIYNGNLIKSSIVDTENFIPGVYLIKFTQGKIFTTKKFIKE